MNSSKSDDDSKYIISSCFCLLSFVVLRSSLNFKRDFFRVVFPSKQQESFKTWSKFYLGAIKGYFGLSVHYHLAHMQVDFAHYCLATLELFESDSSCLAAMEEVESAVGVTGSKSITAVSPKIRDCMNNTLKHNIEIYKLLNVPLEVENGKDEAEVMKTLDELALLGDGRLLIMKCFVLGEMVEKYSADENGLMVDAFSWKQ